MKKKLFSLIGALTICVATIYSQSIVLYKSNLVSIERDTTNGRDSIYLKDNRNNGFEQGLFRANSGQGERVPQIVCNDTSVALIYEQEGDAYWYVFKYFEDASSKEYIQKIVNSNNAIVEQFQKREALMGDLERLHTNDFHWKYICYKTIKLDYTMITPGYIPPGYKGKLPNHDRVLKYELQGPFLLKKTVKRYEVVPGNNKENEAYFEIIESLDPNTFNTKIESETRIK